MGEQEAKGKAVYFPENLWGKLATIADDRGVSIGELIVAAVGRIASPLTVEQRVVGLVRAGHPDALIAGETGELLHRVANIRRAAGLPPNRMHR